MRVVAVLLAAGAGRRVGGPKALLRVEGVTFVQACLAALDRPGVAQRVVVAGHGREAVADLEGLEAVHLAVNPDPDAGMLGSVLVGIEAAEALAADAVLLHPVDHPLVEAETVDRVVAALAAGARVAVPSHQGRRGHPGGFARSAWPALRAAPADRGARAVLADHPDWVVHVPGGPGCRIGVNTPEDLARVHLLARRR